MFITQCRKQSATKGSIASRHSGCRQGLIMLSGASPMSVRESRVGANVVRRPTLQRPACWCSTMNKQEASASPRTFHSPHRDQRARKLQRRIKTGTKEECPKGRVKDGCVRLQGFRAQQRHAKINQCGEPENFVERSSPTETPEHGLVQETQPQ